MNLLRTIVLAFSAFLGCNGSCGAASPTLPGVGAAMEQMIAQNEIAGAVTVVVTRRASARCSSTAGNSPVIVT